MKTVKRLFLLALASFPAFAGFDATASITYVPVNATPTLSETMLIALGLLLPVVAFRSMRNMKGGRSMAALLIFGGLLVTEAVTGYKMLPRAQAVVNNVMTNPAGGTLSGINVSVGSPVTVTNSTNVNMLLQTVSWTNLLSGIVPRTGGSFCTQGAIVNAAGTCTLAVLNNNN
jgi:uncharacterized membrane protein